MAVKRVVLLVMIAEEEDKEEEDEEEEEDEKKRFFKSGRRFYSVFSLSAKKIPEWFINRVGVTFN